ncbi:hypothetical protein OHB26_35815 [Nocardia sp. NBC_01503]|uniref:hypothetical protein n=1 Tax=Nocardia sp. NBC_01503 TaxID=2975997 RepID=UPI002E7B96E2|nr:hypothetical protein [Nocardia sp. NBC_01503]WTL32198.1 hypothetical protein OHB26_35815 [Nocardia sp. NBC_01503]
MRWSLVLLSVLALIAGCARGTTDSEWKELALPASGARVVELVPVRDGVLALGSVPSGEDRAPAAWTSSDGSHWRAVAVEPRSPYGSLAELISAGVGDRTVVLGRAFGGSHGNPRMTVWSGDSTKLVEYPQVFELFGGPHSIAVTAAASLGGTDLLIGGWDGADGRYGVAVWVSADGANWQRRVDDPALSSGAGELTGASAITTGPAGFVIVGETQRDGTQLPLEWTSRDGSAWQRIAMPGTAALATQVGCNPARCTVFGQSTLAAPTVLCWPSDTAAAIPGPAATTIDTLKVLVRDARTFAVVRLDGAVHLLSVRPDCTDWQDLPLPVPAARAQLTELPNGLLLSTIEDNASRLWLRAHP